MKFESLDTSYVNLSALIRYLRERNFKGRLHVALEEYEADVFLHGSETPNVSESNHSTGREAHGGAALDRLLVRAREPGGLISIFEQPPESTKDGETWLAPELSTQKEAATVEVSRQEPIDWDRLLSASGDLIAAVERAVQSLGEQFEKYFDSARIELGDDYPFLDPTLGDVEYSGSIVHLRHRPSPSAYILGMVECLRRTVNMVGDTNRFRERVAVELALVARRRPDALAPFMSHLDRIAGTRVL